MRQTNDKAFICKLSWLCDVLEISEALRLALLGAAGYVLTVVFLPRTSERTRDVASRWRGSVSDVQLLRAPESALLCTAAVADVAIAALKRVPLMFL